MKRRTQITKPLAVWLLIFVALRVVLTAWAVYFTIVLAQHVNAWPF